MQVLDEPLSGGGGRKDREVDFDGGAGVLRPLEWRALRMTWGRAGSAIDPKEHWSLDLTSPLLKDQGRDLLKLWVEARDDKRGAEPLVPLILGHTVNRSNVIDRLSRLK